MINFAWQGYGRRNDARKIKDLKVLGVSSLNFHNCTIFNSITITNYFYSDFGVSLGYQNKNMY